MAEMSSVTISIIIPIYNTGEPLRQCLDSILSQTFTDYECILVDDGSTDDSGIIADEYAAKNERFQIIHKKNGGVSSARNMGLRCAKGEWVVFVDSDDYILPNHLATMIDVAINDVDIVMTGFRFLHLDQVTEHIYSGNIYIGKDKIREFINKSDFLQYQIPWDRMYRRSMIENNSLSFLEGLSLSEDRLFCYHYLIHVKGIVTTKEITYVHDGRNVDTLSYKIPDVNIQIIRLLSIMKASKRIMKKYNMVVDKDNRLCAYNIGLLDMFLHTKSSIYSKLKYLISCLFIDFQMVSLFLKYKMFYR